MSEYGVDLAARRKARVSIALWIAIPTLAAFITWVMVFSTNGYVPKTLSEVMVTSAYVHPEIATDSVCKANDCLEAWTTDVGTFMRFHSHRKAEYVAYLLGDQSRRNGTIVLDFGDSKVSIRQKIDAIELLFPGKDWY